MRRARVCDVTLAPGSVGALEQAAMLVMKAAATAKRIVGDARCIVVLLSVVHPPNRDDHRQVTAPRAPNDIATPATAAMISARLPRRQMRALQIESRDFVVVCLLALVAPGVAAAQSTLIHSAVMVDGRGGPGYRGSVRDHRRPDHRGRQRGRGGGRQGHRCKGLTLAPGFIDTLDAERDSVPDPAMLAARYTLMTKPNDACC